MVNWGRDQGQTSTPSGHLPLLKVSASHEWSNTRNKAYKKSAQVGSFSLYAHFGPLLHILLFFVDFYEVFITRESLKRSRFFSQMRRVAHVVGQEPVRQRSIKRKRLFLIMRQNLFYETIGSTD